MNLHSIVRRCRTAAALGLLAATAVSSLIFAPPPAAAASTAFILPTAGTMSYEGYIVQGGLGRRYVAIRPVISAPDAPVLMLLHPRGESPEGMANITAAGRLAAQHGAWVLLPEALRGDWHDNPRRVDGPDDVAFLTALLDAVLPINRLDASHVYVAGYSNGGYMAERLACARADRIAGVATVGAPLRASIAADCPLTRPMPVVQFHGTGDLIVPYRGNGPRTGADEGVRYWASRAGCTPGAVAATVLPNRERRDQTRIVETRYTGCPRNVEIRLYTVERGGHTWPGSAHAAYTGVLGPTSGDVDATLELWNVLSRFSRIQR